LQWGLAVLPESAQEQLNLLVYRLRLFQLNKMGALFNDISTGSLDFLD
jgi:hypothetical protein